MTCGLRMGGVSRITLMCRSKLEAGVEWGTSPVACSAGDGDFHGRTGLVVKRRRLLSPTGDAGEPTEELPEDCLSCRAARAAGGDVDGERDCR